MSDPNSKPYRCPVCDETFETAHQRGGHFGTNHSRQAKRDSLLDELQQIADKKGASPTLSDIDDCNWGSPTTFKSVFDSWQDAVEAIDHEPQRRKLSEEELLAELQRLRIELGRIPRQDDVPDRARYSKSAYRNHFGCWNEALIAAGFEPTKRNKIPESELLEELERVATQLSESPTREEFDQHGEFCSQTYTNRFGSWNDALEAVGCDPNRDVDFSADDLIRELREMADRLDKPPSANDVKELSEYGLSAYEREFGSWTKALKIAGTGTNQPHSISDERLLSSLQELATDLGSTPTVVENRKWGEYSFGAYQNSFGSWNNALRTAGLDLNSEQNISREDLLAEVTRLAEELGKPPTSEEMDAYGRYSTNPYYAELDTWSSWLEAAGYSPWKARCHEPHPIYGVGWNEEIREKVRNRDGRECVACGISETAHLDDFGRCLDVHHICGARMSTNPAVFNAPRNLVTLCMSCHVDAEPYTPGLPPYIGQPVTRNEE